MSGLAAVLAGRHAPGAYRWASNLAVADVEHAVVHAGWAFAHLDGAGIETMAQLHEAVARALGFPSYYGANLDALADCLRDVDPRTVLLWDAWSGPARAHERPFAVALGLLGERITVLLRGPGPDVVPALA